MCLCKWGPGTVSAIFCLLWHCHGQTITAASDGRVFSLAKHEYKKDMNKRKEKKNSTETQTEIETIIRLQHIFITALLPRPWKHHMQFLRMSLCLLTNTDVNTVHRLSSAISPSKKMKFSPNRSTKSALC